MGVDIKRAPTVPVVTPIESITITSEYGKKYTILPYDFEPNKVIFRVDGSGDGWSKINHDALLNKADLVAFARAIIEFAEDTNG